LGERWATSSIAIFRHTLATERTLRLAASFQNAATIWREESYEWAKTQRVTLPGANAAVVLLFQNINRNASARHRLAAACAMLNRQRRRSSAKMSTHHTSWNHGAEQLFGYPAKEVVGKQSPFSIPPDRFERGTPNILNASGRERAIEHYETIRQRRMEN